MYPENPFYFNLFEDRHKLYYLKIVQSQHTKNISNMLPFHITLKLRKTTQCV